MLNKYILNVVKDRSDEHSLVLKMSDSTLANHIELAFCRETNHQEVRREFVATLPMDALEKLHQAIGVYLTNIDTDFLE